MRGKHLQSRSKILQRRLNTRRRRHLLAVSVPPGGLSRQWLAAKHQVPSVASHRTSNDVLKIERSHARHDLKIHAHHYCTSFTHMFTCVPLHCTSVQWQTSWMHPWHHSNAKRTDIERMKNEHWTCQDADIPLDSEYCTFRFFQRQQSWKYVSNLPALFGNYFGRSILIGATGILTL